MTKLFLLLVFVTLPAFARPHSCLRDFHTAQRPVAHHLSGGDLARLESYVQAGQTADGWHYLANLGDPYAQMAWKIVDTKDPRFQKFHKMGLKYWWKVVGREKTAATFQKVAHTHFKHYVEILETGYWPDSDQILLSYLTATREQGLPDKVVFDAAWIHAGFSHILAWQKVVHVPRDRWVTPSKVCIDVHGGFFAFLFGLLELPL